MTQAEDVRRIRESLEGHAGPVFSVYLSVNARYPENQRQAYKTRLKDALEELEVPEEIGGRVWEEVEEIYRPGARTLVFFSAGDGLFERYELQVDLPESYRFGEPYLAPLVLALDEHEPYGVALLDAEEFRFFVSSSMEEPTRGSQGDSSGFFREVDLKPSEPYPRGGRDQETESRRTEANIHKFYNQLGELTRDLTFREGVHRLILAGPKERTSEFRNLLPNDVKNRVVAEEHVNIGGSEGELLDELEAIRERSEYEREGELLGEIRERGVRGPAETIKALQEENRVYHLAVLWELDGEVRWSDADGLAIMDITQEKSPYSGEPTRVRSMADVLVELAAERGARLDFLRGENENTDVLRDEFGGVAGLLRF